MKYITAELNKKKICYSDQTDFLVQIGKGKSSYQTRYKFTGDLQSAVFYFNCINVHSGYKKRLYAPSMNRPTLARVITI